MSVGKYQLAEEIGILLSSYNYRFFDRRDFLKRIICFIIALIAIDQAVKLFIAQFYINVEIIFIQGVLLFRPVQNTNLLWVASVAENKPSVYMVIIIQIFAALMVVLIHRYISYIWNNHQGMLNTYLILSLSGVCCSFIDVVFWGGSLDYIRLFDWFTFDMKDAFLTFSQVLLILSLLFVYMPHYYKLSKEERKQHGILHWIKKGLPTKPVKKA